MGSAARAEAEAEGILNQMVTLSPAPGPDLDSVFAALADPTRRAIVSRLASGEASVSTLAGPFEMSLPAVAKHLRVLQRAGLIEDRKIGRERRCRLAAEPLKAADDWLRRYQSFWAGRLDSLAAHLTSRRERDE